METAGRLFQTHRDGLAGAASLRLALVIAIIVFQSIQVSESYLRTISGPLWILSAILYPALFVVGGFLLARSVEQRSLRGFIERRARRLLPALVVVVLASALLLGPAATTKSLRSYATDPEFPLYLLNIVAWPRFSLPGVFQFNNVGTVVNLPLWLSPFVVAMIVVVLIARVFGTRVLVGAAILVAATVLGLMLYVPGLAGISGLQRNLLDGTGGAVVLAFVLGALAWRLRFRLPMHPYIFYAALAVLAGAAIAGNRSWLGVPVFNLLIAIPAGYAALYLMFQDLPLPAQALRLERYLFGMLLFSFPVQQFWIAFGPRQQPFALNFVLALPTAALLAALTWHGVQRWLFLPSTDDPRFGEIAAQPLVALSVRQMIGRIPAILPYVALVLVLFAAALGIMALVLLAFQPESRGV